MTYVHTRSSDCLKSELDLFEAPPTQTSLEKGDWQEYPPHATLSANGPLEFYISGAGDEYIDLLHTMLYIRCRIVDSAGVPLGHNVQVGPVNNFIHSLFSQVEVQLNGHVIGHNNSLYPYRAIIEKLLNYGPEASQAHLQAELFHKDTPSFMDVANPLLSNRYGYITDFDDLPESQNLDQVTGPGVAPIEDGKPVRVQLPASVLGNHGLHWRWRYTRGSQWVELLGPIHHDIFQQERYLPNNVSLAVKFTRSKPEFCLMSGEAMPAYRVDIQDALLYVRRMKLGDNVFLAHQQTLLSANAVFPLSKVIMKSFSIPGGNLHGPQDNIFLGQLPQEIIIVFIDNDALSGNYAKNPFNFKNMDVRSMVIKYDGRPVPSHPLSLSYRNMDSGGGSYLRAFMQLYTSQGKWLQDKGGLIERQDFGRGYAIYAFDMRPALGCRGHYELKRHGAVQVDVQFGAALPNTISMIVYGTQDGFAEISQSRDILMDS